MTPTIESIRQLLASSAEREKNGGGGFGGIKSRVSKNPPHRRLNVQSRPHRNPFHTSICTANIMIKTNTKIPSDVESAIYLILGVMEGRRNTDLKEARSLPCGDASSARHYGRHEAMGEVMGLIAGLIPVVDVLVRSYAQADQQIERQLLLLKKRPALTSEEEVEESKLDHLP